MNNWKSSLAPRAFWALSLVSLAACGAPEDEPLADETFALGDLPTIELLPSVTPDGQAIALTAKNASGKPVTCKSLAFRAPIARLDHCGELPLSNEFIELTGLRFAAQEAKIWANTPDANAGGVLGAARIATLAEDRKKQGFGDEILEYCPMGGSERLLDCGYDCTAEGRAYGEPDWTVGLSNGGTKKWRCQADGVAVTIETRCAGDMLPGQQSRVPGGEGTTLVRTCQADGSIFQTAECSAGYQQTPDRQSCEPAACGAVPHGGEYFQYNVDNGKVVSTCRYGQPDPNTTRAMCNAEFVPSGLTCVPRPMRDCGPGRPHGWSRTYYDCHTGGEYRVRQWCTDGKLNETSTKVGKLCR